MQQLNSILKDFWNLKFMILLTAVFFFVPFLLLFMAAEM